jgi:hypothetical protein
LCLVAPYPFRLEPLDSEDFDPLVDFDMTGGDDVWFARPQLFFTCCLCPTGRLQDKSSHRELLLVFFSTFEPISLTPNSFMQRSGIPMVYERAASQLPTLYVCPVENVLCIVPLIWCYLKGNSHNTIPFSSNTMFPMVLLLIPGKTAGQTAGFSRSTSGCCATEGHFKERFRSRMQKRCSGSAFENQGVEELKL